MNKWIVGLGLALSSCAWAGRQDVPTKTVDEIWSHADTRMEIQGDHWFKNGDFPRAAHLVRFRFQLNPANYDRLTDLGFLLKSMHMYDQELAIYVMFRLKMVAKDPDAAFPEANFYFERKMYAKVPPLLEPTMASSTTPHRNTFSILARSYEKQGLLGKAVSVWKRFLTKVPNDPTALANVNRIEKKQKDGPKPTPSR